MLVSQRALHASRKESTTRAQSFLDIIGPEVRAMLAVTFSTRSALVICPSFREIPYRPEIRPPRGVNIGAYLLPVKSLQEFLEVIPSVMGTWGSLWVILHGKNREISVPNPFDGVVIEVKVGDFE